jgi:hypothetical protein
MRQTLKVFRGPTGTSLLLEIVLYADLRGPSFLDRFLIAWAQISGSRFTGGSEATFSLRFPFLPFSWTVPFAPFSWTVPLVPFSSTVPLVPFPLTGLVSACASSFLSLSKRSQTCFAALAFLTWPGAVFMKF